MHGCGKVEADDRGRIPCGQARELDQCRDAGLSGFAEELDGPGAQHRFAILEQGKEIALGQAVDDVQTPQGAQALGRGAGVRQLGFQDGIRLGEDGVSGLLPGGCVFRGISRDG